VIHFVVPAFNEEENISDYLAETHRFAEAQGWKHRFVVVDDGSTDRTAEKVLEAARRMPCELVSYQPNRGVAEAFRRGFHEALRTAGPDDWIVTQEADRTGDLQILPGMIRSAEQGADAVLASCYAPGGGVEGTTPLRMLLSRGANGLIRSTLGLHGIRTYSSFYRVYRPAALRRVIDKYRDFYEEAGFACVIELLVRLVRTGSTVVETPMVLQGSKRRGPSKMKVLRTIGGYFRVIGRNVLSR
jgi:dolichol-phosphate mannosyltransferase